jgi:hypothetical protein
MTAVQGIELLPPQESERLPAREVKSKGEISPFEKLLTPDNIKEKSNLEDPAKFERKILPFVKDGPEHPSFYSTERLEALLKGVLSSSSNSEKLNFQIDGLPVLDHKPGQDFLMPASLWKNESIQESQREEMKKIISLLLKGELGSEELEKLITTNPELVQKNDSPAKISPDLINLELKDKIIFPESGEDSLKGVLTEEGELIYFDETVIKDGEKSLKGSKDTSLKFMDQSRNKMVVEISVKDLRDSRDQSVPNIVSTHQNQVLNAAMEGKKGESLDSDVSDDILNSPAEKLFSPEGGGGKLQAPVTKEVSRLFQDYMKDTGSRDLVKKIDFILKNDNQGEIKLILKPEALGNVRINLSLNENNIAGKIFVDNSSVREIFLNNMEQISNQLRANGYNVASLDVWVGQEGQSGQKGQQELEQDKKYRSAERIKRFDQSVPQAAPGSYVNEGEVNLVV